MKITDIILEYGNAPNNSSDPKVAGGVPNAVGNLKARRLARGGSPTTAAAPTPAPTTATTAAPTPATAPAGRAPIDDLLDAPDSLPASSTKKTKDNYIDKLGNIFNRYADGKSYAVGNFANDNKDMTTGYSLNKQGTGWIDPKGNAVTDAALLQLLNKKAKQTKA